MSFFFWFSCLVIFLLFLGYSFSPCAGYSINYFCRARFVFIYYVNLVLSWNILVSPSMVIESLAGYSNMGWHLCSFRVCMMSFQYLLVFIVSFEKSGVILIGLPLYVTWPVSLPAFSILSLFWTFGVLTIMCWEKFFSGLVLGKLLVCSWSSLF